jgi:hypothetical protein
MKKLLSIAVIAIFVLSCNTPQPTSTPDATTTGTDTTGTRNQTTTDTSGRRPDSLQQAIPGIR